MCQKVAAQKKAKTRAGVGGKKAKGQNLFHRVEENSLVNSAKVLDGGVHVKA
uniref:Uncharacterized protein n=1 Tax=viral metagenome TaxID=1070528 RepID=A0A6C0F537_9ZZZZ